jgi:hypothetical protein
VKSDSKLETPNPKLPLRTFQTNPDPGFLSGITLQASPPPRNPLQPWVFSILTTPYPSFQLHLPWQRRGAIN